MRRPSESGYSNVERLHPFMFPGHREALKHVSRYLWAARWIQGLDIVHDRACGYGYGSLILAHSAQKVVGYDMSPEAIEWARQTYCWDRLSFEVADLRKLDTKTEVIVSFETIEHIREWEDVFCKFIQQSKLLIFSVPYMQANIPRVRMTHQAFGFREDSFDNLLEGKKLEVYFQKEDSNIVPFEHVKDEDRIPGSCLVGVVQGGELSLPDDVGSLHIELYEDNCGKKQLRIHDE